MEFEIHPTKEWIQEVNKLIKENRKMELEFDLGDFVNDMVEEWEIDQLMEYAVENLMDFYGKHPEIAKEDYKLFIEDHSAHHVQGY